MTTLFNSGGGKTKQIVNFVKSYKASKELDGMAEQSWTVTKDCWVVVSVFGGSARGSSQYIRKNGTEVSYAASAFQNYRYGYCMATFEAKKGDVITCKPYQSDTNIYSYVNITAYA